MGKHGGGSALSLKKQLQAAGHKQTSAKPHRQTVKPAGSGKNGFKAREQKKQDRLVMQEMEKALVGKMADKKRTAAKRRMEKKKRKAENEIKSGVYTVITNTEKIRKWNKKAKKTLVKMSPEVMAQLAAKQR